ncbi:MAG: B12-binding domain-containing radical SAM protein [Candidatus Omnitrophica bacterium]|nr:B12-binding domain-containing radical SAM protein [Candidatus Omnitrophota bacterium]
MKKILLLNPPGKNKYLRDQYCSSSAKADYYWPAIDLLVLSGIISSHFQVEVLDAIAEKMSAEQTFKFIKNASFSAVCALTSSSSKDEDFLLFNELKKNRGLKIILNGGFLRHNTQKYLEEFKFIDAVIVDYTQNGVVDYIKGEKGRLPGIWYKSGGSIQKESCYSDDEDIFSYPVPRHELFPLNKYCLPQARNFPFTCVLISSGCPFKCKFCSSSSIHYRKRDVENLLIELKAIKSAGIKEVHFPDFTFTADKGHCLKVCRAMIDAGLDLSWDCLSRADCFDAELARTMKKAGCHTIQFGVESQNEQVLENLAKPLANKTVRDAFELCQREGIDTIGFFIIGLPQEDEPSIKKTIAFACDLNCDYASFSVFVPDFGAPIRTELEKKDPRLKNVYKFDRTDFPVTVSEFISKERIWQLRNIAMWSFYLRPGYIWKMLGKIKSGSRLRVAAKIFWSICKEQLKPRVRSCKSR